MKKRRIGLFGGTFDPIHNLHIEVVEACINQQNLDEAWFMLDKIPRHKQPLASYADRLAMLEIALKDKKGLIWQQKTDGMHELLTLISLQQQNPNSEFYIITGLDVILNIEQWANYRDFFGFCGFVVIRRPGSDLSQFEELKNRLLGFGFKYEIIDFSPSIVSSSSIRSSKDFYKNSDLPKDVAKYIVDKKLYT